MPSRAFTAASVERTKPPAKGQVDHFDKGFPGLALRVSYGGGKTWTYFYRAAGRLRRLKLGTYPGMTLAEAREAWRAARKETAAGRDPAAQRPSLAVATVAQEWLEKDQAKNRSHRAIERIVERLILPAWQHRSIAEIGRRDVLDLIESVSAPMMARRTFSAIHRMLNWCVRRGIIEHNPASNIDRPGVAVSRERVLNDRELVAVWNAAEQLGWPHGAAVKLLALTGARRSEIWELRWDEIEDGLIRLSGLRTKNGEPHTIPLSTPAISIVEAIPRIAGSDYVFAARKPSSNWSNAKADIDAQAKIAPWRMHDLRRTVATGLQKLGTGLQTIEAVLGHTSGSRAGIVGVYQRHSFDAEKRAALEAWGAHVMGLVS
jgi:integrase